MFFVKCCFVERRLSSLSNSKQAEVGSSDDRGEVRGSQRTLRLQEQQQAEREPPAASQRSQRPQRSAPPALRVALCAFVRPHGSVKEEVCGCGCVEAAAGFVRLFKLSVSKMLDGLFQAFNLKGSLWPMLSLKDGCSLFCRLAQSEARTGVARRPR